MRNRSSVPILRGISIAILSIAVVLTVVALIGYSRQRNNYPRGMKIAGVAVGGAEPDALAGVELVLDLALPGAAEAMAALAPVTTRSRRISSVSSAWYRHQRLSATPRSGELSAARAIIP